MSGYQDVRIHGRTVRHGYRESEHRYEVIRSYLAERFGNCAFTVCDIGAHNCYFGLRLLEDFPHCHVVAFEFNRFAEHAAIVKANHPTRLLFLERKISQSDVETLGACCRFDVVLLLNVLHHFGGNFGDWMTRLRRLGRVLIAEFAMADSRSRRTPRGYHVPGDAIVLGRAPSHIKPRLERPIVAISGAAA